MLLLGQRSRTLARVQIYLILSYIQFAVLAPSRSSKTEGDKKLYFDLLALVMLKRSFTNFKYDISILKGLFKPLKVPILAFL